VVCSRIVTVRSGQVRRDQVGLEQSRRIGLDMFRIAQPQAILPQGRAQADRNPGAKCMM
jgi:hypothetical protein